MAVTYLHTRTDKDEGRQEAGRDGLKPYRITMTGADPSCRLHELVELLASEPRLELALLYSETQQGTGRYPPAAWIHEVAAASERRFGYGGQGRRVALHVCGRAVQRFLSDGPSDLGLGNLARFSRIQLNGRLAVEQVAALCIRLMEFREFPIPIITQFDANPWLDSPMVHDEQGQLMHQVLFDASGGRGIERSEWPKHLHKCVCGYAGGLGPDNIVTEIARIAGAAGGNRYWIDMEGKLRDAKDQFSIERAYEVLAQVAVWEAGIDGREAEDVAVGDVGA